MFSGLLRQRVQERPRSRDTELDLPAGDDGYPGWLTASSQVAAGAFADTDPDAPMWVWGADPHARFWMRRMLFETLVHRVDAELAVGLRPEIDPALAADGVDEFLVNLPFAASFAPKTAELRGQDETIRFRCTDRAGDWLIRLRPDGFGLDAPRDAEAAHPADATVQGAAADLLLLLYGRLDRTCGRLRDVGGRRTAHALGCQLRVLRTRTSVLPGAGWTRPVARPAPGPRVKATECPAPPSPQLGDGCGVLMCVASMPGGRGKIRRTVCRCCSHLEDDDVRDIPRRRRRRTVPARTLAGRGVPPPCGPGAGVHRTAQRAS